MTALQNSNERKTKKKDEASKQGLASKQATRKRNKKREREPNRSWNYDCSIQALGAS
jgi:hypothetical protein